jgi:4,5-dihydroxyphthalate decarboxylase
LGAAFEAAKNLAFEGYEDGLCSLPWANLDFEFARQMIGEDVYPYGLKNNLPTLEAATLYSYEQGLTKRRFALEELFAEETLDGFD